LEDREAAEAKSIKPEAKAPVESVPKDKSSLGEATGKSKPEPQKEKTEPAEKKATPKPSAAVEHPGGPLPAKPSEAVPAPAELVAPAELHQPSVVFSSEHAQTCKKLVGDAMPDLKLADLDAKDLSLGGLRGSKLTVVVFWSTKEALGREQFQKLESEALGRYRGHGVNVVAVNVGDEPDKVRQAYQAAKATFPCLVDKNKTAFAEVATGILPRTYLLAADGRILWMDLVYSSTTRRELNNAIHFYLQEQKK
jgi:peroxiredoxin